MCLKKLYKKNHIPILLSLDEEKKSFFTNYCGIPLDEYNIPKDWKKQIHEIVEILKKKEIYNNDIWINNFLVNNGIIYLIDFGWGTKKSPSYPYFNITEEDLHNHNDLIELLDMVYERYCEERINFRNYITQA